MGEVGGGGDERLRSIEQFGDCAVGLWVSGCVDDKATNDVQRMTDQIDWNNFTNSLAVLVVIVNFMSISNVTVGL